MKRSTRNLIISLRLILLLILGLILLTQYTARDHQQIAASPVVVRTTLLPSQPIGPNQATPENSKVVTPIGTSLPTLVPTFTFEEAEKYILEQIENNGKCRLPCIWGLAPGSDSKTTEEYYHRFPFTTRGKDSISNNTFEELGGLSYSFESDRGITWLNFDYYIKDGKLDQLVLFAQFAEVKNGEYLNVFGYESLDTLMRFYSLSQILTEYGQPDEIYFYAWGLDPVEKIPKESYLIAMYYVEQGFLIQYNGFVNQNTGSNLIICPKEMSIYLTTWDPALNPSLEEVTKSGTSFTLMSDYLEIFDTIDVVSSINKDEFYETYQNPDFTECFETPAELWKR